MNKTRLPLLRRSLAQRLAVYFTIVALLCIAFTSGSLFIYYRSTINRETSEIAGRFERYLASFHRRVKATADLLATAQRTMCGDKRLVAWLEEEHMSLVGAGDLAYWKGREQETLLKGAFNGELIVSTVWQPNVVPEILLAIPLDGDSPQTRTVLLASRKLDREWLDSTSHELGSELAILDREGRVLTSSFELDRKSFSLNDNDTVVQIAGKPFGFHIYPFGEEGRYAVLAPAETMRNLAFFLSGLLAVAFSIALGWLYISYRLVTGKAAGEIENLAAWADGYLEKPERQRPPATHYHELTLVAEAFDNLVSRLDTAMGEIERQNRELAGEVEKKTAQLSERNQLLDSIVTEMPQALFLLSADGLVIYANSHADEDFSIRTGDPFPEAIGSQLSKLGEDVTFTFIAFEGRDYLFHTRLLEGSGVRLVLAMDVTERRIMEEQLFQTQKMESVSRLAGGVAHDFNNALASIIPCVDMLRLKISDEKALSYVSTIEKAALRGADVVRKLLAFSRAGSFTPKEIDLNEVVEGAVKVFRPTAKYAELNWLPGEGLPHVHGDEAQLQQLIFNLGINSLDASDGRCTITIKTWTDEERKKVYLSVADNGPGVPPEVAEHIFDPFFTTKKQSLSKTQGTGLGLSVAYGVVDRHGGRIRLVVGTQPGANFEVEFPAWTEDQSKPAAKPTRGGSLDNLVIGGK